MFITPIELENGEMIYVTTKECHKQHKLKRNPSLLNQARKVLKKKNFVTTKCLAQLLKIKGQAASRLLVKLPEWNKYGARSWAREGYPI